MTDFWEILGRAVTDDAFRTALFAGPYNPAMYKPVPGKSREIIPKTDYDKVTSIIRGATATKYRPPLSLFALGEILHDMSVPGFNTQVKNLAQAIKDSGVPIHPVDANFHMALGAMIVDAQLQVHLVAGNWDADGFSAVQPADRATLQTLFDESAHHPVVKAAADLCGIEWGIECFVKAFFWPPSGHGHPVA